ncbi:MAG TPA: Spy/CpxP family protein refolding chaperone [Geopsychrobacteraceae bacterium]|nr:Spy/CpxP family protein refolding chaperone [Geopsychrobacteraceae bacterium]
MSKTAVVAALITGTLLTGIAISPAIAGRGYGNCDGPDNTRHQERQAERSEHRLENMTKVLELTDVQQSQIKTIFAGVQEKQKDQYQQRSNQRKQLQDLKSAATFDEDAFRAQAEKMAAHKIDMQVERMKTRQQILALLTTEQQEKAAIMFQSKKNCGPGHGMKY